MKFKYPIKMRMITYKAGFLRKHIIIVWIILFGVLHGLIYALVMPPWGLLDESQHFHYIQFVAEEHRLPVMWEDQLSIEIVDSFFATKRYVTLGNDRMPDRAEVIIPGRLDSESYEAYQPPLYYLLLSFFYLLGPPDVLLLLFFLRIAGVLFSGITLFVIWRSSRLLFPQHTWIAIAATMFVALLPERAASVARVNNDVLLEVMCAVSFGLLATAIAKGFSWRRVLWLGLTLGLAALTKLSALIVAGIIISAWGVLAWRRGQRRQVIFGQTILLLAVISIFTFPLFIRNIILYQDITGANAFLAQVGDLGIGTVSQRLFIGTVDMFRNSWVVLWDGMLVVTKPSATVLFFLLFVTMLGIAVSLVAAWLRKDKLLPKSVVVVSLAAIGLVSFLVLMGYVKGFLPTVQGRFLLPVIVPSAWLVGLGLWLIGKRWRGFTVSFLLMLEFVLGMSVLFFHTLPKYYAPRGISFLGYWQQTSYLLSPEGLFWDKPHSITLALLAWVIIGFVLSGIAVLVWGEKLYGFPLQLEQLLNIWHSLQQKWYSIKPDIQGASRYAIVNDVSWRERLKQLLKDPLLWTGVGLFIVYLGWVSWYPAEIFWSLDEGGKYIHLQSIVRTMNLSAAVPYPGRSLDPDLQFVPLYFWSRVNDQIYSWWPVGFSIVTIPFYLAFGWIGLYILPAAFGAFSAVVSGILLRYIVPDKWLPVIGMLIVGLATPVAFYSTTFWEHTLNAGVFLGGMWAVLAAWRRNSIAKLVVAAILFSMATYFRVDTVAMIAGIGLILLLIRWRWAIIFGVSYVIAILPWMFTNVLLMGHFLGRQWLPDATTGDSLSATVFPGLRDAGWQFVPFALFNPPAIAAFSMPDALLITATVATIMAVILPFFAKFHGLLLLIYAILLTITAWVLFQHEGYRSVHGFVLVAPHVVFGVWLYVAYAKFRQSPFPLMLMGIGFVFALAYLVRGWVAAGGLQWGPRYLIIFYPLLVVGSLGGLASIWKRFNRKMQYGIVVVYIAMIFIGVGYQVRGFSSALITRRYYQQTEGAVELLNADNIVTHCPWLPMVMPRLYWTQNIYTLRGSATFEDWQALSNSNQAEISSVCVVEMDLCELTLLDDIAVQRKTNPGGLQSQCFSQQ